MRLNAGEQSGEYGVNRCKILIIRDLQEYIYTIYAHLFERKIFILHLFKVIAVYDVVSSILQLTY